MTTNKHSGITILGIELDNPLDCKELYKRELTEYKEGARITVKSVWLNSYETSANTVSCQSYNLTMTNRGVCSLDGKPIRDKVELENVKEIFNSLEK